MAAMNVVYWPNLPDPRDPSAPGGARCRVEAHPEAWWHLAQKHAANPGEPWHQWLSPAALSALRRFGDVGPMAANDPVTRAGLAEAAAAIGDGIRQTLERPLAFLYRVRKSGGRDLPGHRWVLILPSGATVAVHGHQQGNRFKTCFFSAAACRQRRPERRWRRAADALVIRHGRHEGGRWLPPEPEALQAHHDESGQLSEHWFAREFVTPATWGFHSPPPPAPTRWPAPPGRHVGLGPRSRRLWARFRPNPLEPPEPAKPVRTGPSNSQPEMAQGAEGESHA